MKPQIYVGAPGSGKSRVAGMIAKHVGKENVCWISGRNPRNIELLMDGFDSKLKGSEILLIIEDIPSDFDYTKLLHSISTNKSQDLEFRVRVSPRAKKEFVAHIPQLIITTDAPISEFQSQGMSFKRRFDVVEFPLSSPDFKIDTEKPTTRITKKALLETLEHCLDHRGFIWFCEMGRIHHALQWSMKKNFSKMDVYRELRKLEDKGFIERDKSTPKFSDKTCWFIRSKTQKEWLKWKMNLQEKFSKESNE